MDRCARLTVEASVASVAWDGVSHAKFGESQRTLVKLT
jgi:hypothetical protein